MECQPCDSKRVFKMFDASKRKKGRKKHDGGDDHSASEDSVTLNDGANLSLKPRPSSAKASIQELTTGQILDELGVKGGEKREIWNRDSSPDVNQTPTDQRNRSPKRHRRSHKEGISLALKAGRISTPRSLSPTPGENLHDTIPNDQDSFIYNFLEDAIMKHKKKQRHLRSKAEDQHEARESSISREHRHHRRRHRDEKDRHEDRHRSHRKALSPPPSVSPVFNNVNQQILLETFAKLCTQISDKANTASQVQRTLSHKSLQCEVDSKNQSYDDQRPERLRTRENSHEILPTRIRSHENFRKRHSQENIIVQNMTEMRIKPDNYDYNYDKESVRYASKMDIIRSKEAERYRDYEPPEISRTRSHIDIHGYKDRPSQEREYRDYDGRKRDGRHEDEKRRLEQKTSRSYDLHREMSRCYIDDERCRRVARSEVRKCDPRRYEDRDKHYDERDRRYEDKDVRERKYDDRHRDRFNEKVIDVRDRNYNNFVKDKRRSRRVIDSKFERMSIASKEDDYNRDRYSERERDSGLSVADDASTLSGKSHYIHVVKQEIAEQREAMDKMMRLWKELMRCFKGNSPNCNGHSEKDMQQTATNARDSAAEQLRLWRECMRRYETVARDVGDTDARLMEEINKQRSEMSEMANMWQECLQRYRDISKDFNNLKQKLTTDSPTRGPPATSLPPPMMCAEGEGMIPAPQYRMTPNYPPVPQMPGGYMPPPGNGGSPLRSRASAPPAWWWSNEQPRVSPRRRSSPDSRGSHDRDRDRDRRHRHKEHDREPAKYKTKSKPNASRSEHRHRKR